MKHLKITLLFALTVLLCASGQVFALTATIPPLADSYVHSVNSGTNYGAATNLYVGDENGNTPAVITRSYLKFDLSVLPAGSTIINAQMNLRCWSLGNPIPMDVSAHLCFDDTWTETAINWTNAPAFNTIPSSVTTITGTATYFSWDVTSDAKMAMGNDMMFTEVLLDVAEGTSGRWAAFSSKEDSIGFRPYLSVEYVEPTQEADKDYGDAPEGTNVVAYPSLSVMGSFPTCMNVPVAGFIQHGLCWAHFERQHPEYDFEIEGNGGLCASFSPYDADECFLDLDAGLIIPEPYTIDGTPAVVKCPNSPTGTPLGQTCTTAVWGTDIDIGVHNTMPVIGYVNILIDWNQDGMWGGASTCLAATAPEYVLQDFPIPMGYSGPLSGLMIPPLSFLIGPNPGYVWARFMISEAKLNNPNWDGSGVFEDGESEDYLLKVDAGTTTNEIIKFQQLPLDGPDYFGHDEISTAYTAWDFSGPEPIEMGYEGCYMADDFADLEHSPVIKLKWWGSYPEDEEPSVSRFLIAFERDIPADELIPSHPGEVLYSEIVYLNNVPPLNPGEFSEINVSAGGPPCNERLYEYEAVLQNPFPQDPNTVYWLKIVALYDIGPIEMQLLHDCLASTGYDLCDFMNLPRSQQMEICPDVPLLPRWGWHNRDYTKMDPYASTPPAVVPGEHLAGTIYDPASGADLEVWHFQDDAVSGDIFIDPYNNPFPEYPESPYVHQDPDTWQEEYYVHSWPWCTGTGFVDGPGPSAEHPDGIHDFSKDLAFELYTNDDCFKSTHPDYTEWVNANKPNCWCYKYQCHGDADGLEEGTLKTGYYWVSFADITILANNWQGTSGDTSAAGDYPPDVCADFDRAEEGTLKTGYYRVSFADITILAANWQGTSTDTSTKADDPYVHNCGGEL